MKIICSRRRRLHRAKLATFWNGCFVPAHLLEDCCCFLLRKYCFFLCAANEHQFLLNVSRFPIEKCWLPIIHMCGSNSMPWAHDCVLSVENTCNLKSYSLSLLLPLQCPYSRIVTAELQQKNEAAHTHVTSEMSIRHYHRTCTFLCNARKVFLNFLLASRNRI